jgi:endonuclease G
MQLSPQMLAATMRRSSRLSDDILKGKPFDYTATVKRDVSAAKVAQRTRMMGAGGSKPSETELERMMGTNDLVDEFFLVRALLCARAVARLSIRNPSGGERGSATGFMVSPRLLLTNHHVFGSAETAAPSIAEFNYRDDVSGNPEPSFRHLLRPDLFFYTNADLDFTLVSVDAEPVNEGPGLAAWGWLRLIAESGKAGQKDWLSIIQHPGGRRRQFAIRENQCVDSTDAKYLWYMSDTAPGSSGAPVFNDSFQVAALHHSGRARKEKDKYVLRNGQKVGDLRGVDDSLIDWIANEGVRVSRICAAIAADAREKNGHLEELRAAMQGGDVLSQAFQSTGTSTTESMNPILNQITQGAANGSAITIPVILDLRLSLFGQALGLSGKISSGGAAAAPQRTDSGGGGAAEAYKQPIIDTEYSNRKGYNVKFLGVNVPLPTVVDAKVAAKLKGSTKTVIPYEHFSVVMHATRRLAIYTAANVDWSKKARKPEEGKVYNRDALGGFTKNDDEEWVIEPRLDESAQVTDNFYRRDGGAFDKGHLVRRDDVCWGKDYAEVQRANGDTYHVTNCSPQVAGFNRSLSKGRWGMLENMIQAQGKTEKYCIFTGPILNDGADQSFVGKESATLTIQVPSKFWKVVVCVTGGKLQAYGFLLEQDLSKVPAGVEFAPTEEWDGERRSLKDLEKEIGLIKFDKVLHAADQAPAKKPPAKKAAKKKAAVKKPA